MAKQELITTKGEVLEALSNAWFKIKLETGDTIKAQVNGKMRMYNIRVSIGDMVELEMSPYDLSKGRISRRL